MIRVEAFDHIVLNVRDVEVMANWYERVLGMKRRTNDSDAGDTRTSMHFGCSKINLRPVAATQEQWITGAAPQPGSYDICFVSSLTPEEILEELQGCRVAIVSGPAIKQGAKGPIRSVYVRDPDGNLIELSSYLE